MLKKRQDKITEERENTKADMDKAKAIVKDIFDGKALSSKP